MLVVARRAPGPTAGDDSETLSIVALADRQDANPQWQPDGSISHALTFDAVVADSINEPHGGVAHHDQPRAVVEPDLDRACDLTWNATRDYDLRTIDDHTDRGLPLCIRIRVDADVPGNVDDCSDAPRWGRPLLRELRLPRQGAREAK